MGSRLRFPLAVLAIGQRLLWIEEVRDVKFPAVA